MKYVFYDTCSLLLKADSLFDNKEEITLTKDHLLLTSNRGWVQAQNITEDDDVVII